MSFEFQSTLVNVTPSYRIAGNQIGGVRIEMNGGIKVARVIVTNDADVKFAISGPYESGDPDAIYAALSSDLFEITEGVLLNEAAIAKVEYDAEKVVVDLEGSDRLFTFMPDAVVTEATEIADHTWKLTTASFAALSAAAATWRSSMDGTLEGLSVAITTEVADRIAAITAEEQRVDALIASGMWLFADQASFPSAADNHGRMVHSHADGAMFYAHGGMWHQVAKEVDLQTTIASVASEASTREAADNALDARLDVLEADPTTATALAAGDAATLSSANSYTDGKISDVIGTAPGVLDTLGEIADAINDDANVYTTLVSSIAAVQSDVDGNETDSDAAEAALSARLDVLEADPTTAAAVAAVQADVDQNESDSDSADAALSARLDVLEADPTTATAVAAVQADVDQNESDSDAADAALSARLDVLEADPTTATAVAAVQADVDANEVSRKAVIDLESNITNVKNAVRGTSIAVGNNITLNPASGGRVEIEGDLLLDNETDVIDGAGVTLTSFTNINAYDGRINAVQADVDQNEADADAAIALERGRIDAILASADADKDTFVEIVSLINSVDTANDNAFAAYVLSNDAAVAAVQADVDQNETDSDAADAALSGRLDVLEADPTTAAAVAAVQADVDQNEADGDAADAALSGRLDTLEADPTTATAVAAVQADVDQNEADADAAIALKAPLADPDFTGQLEVDVNLRLEYDSNLTKIHNVLRGTSIEIGNNIQMKPAAAGGRVEVAGAFQIDITEVPEYSNDSQAAAGGIIVGGLYRSGSVLHIRVS